MINHFFFFAKIKQKNKKNIKSTPTFRQIPRAVLQDNYTVVANYFLV